LLIIANYKQDFDENKCLFTEIQDFSRISGGMEGGLQLDMMYQ